VGGAGGERMGVAGADAAGAAGAESAERVEARTGRRLGAVEAHSSDAVAVGMIVALVVGRPRVGMSGLAGGGAGKIVRVVDGSCGRRCRNRVAVRRDLRRGERD